MTDKEREEFVAELRRLGPLFEKSGVADVFITAADELEKLASELKLEESENEHYVRLAFIDAGANPAVTWQQEAERLARENHVLKLGAEAWPEILKDRDERLGALVQSNAEPSVGEDAVNAAFDKWAETQGYGRMGNRLSFHAGVAFGLRHRGD